MERFRGKAGIVCNSNGQNKEEKDKIDEIQNRLQEMGFEVVRSRYLFRDKDVRSAGAAERASELMRLYQTPGISHIFDLSGGDIANEVLEYLDYDFLGKSEKIFWGYSDLTTVINAIYSMTGKSSVLYQIKNLVWEEKEVQRKNFEETLVGGRDTLYDFSYHFVQGQEMKGIVLGGNIRCFLKLAGTKYFPDLRGKLLFLESLGGEEAQMITYLSQLKMLGVFEKIEGIMLGTFIRLEEKLGQTAIVPYVREVAGDQMPIAITGEIGHRPDSKALRIGTYYHWKER